MLHNSCEHDNGLAGRFAVLPCENRELFQQMYDAYIDEYRPITPTEHFLVAELAQAQWRLMRADAIEAEFFNPGEHPSYAGIAASFRENEAVTRLGRYAEAARRAFYKAQDRLEALRRAAANRSVLARREQSRDFERRLTAYIEAPPPGGGPKLALVNEPVMPVHLRRELDTTSTPA